MDPEPFNRLRDCRYGRMLYNVNDAYIGRSLDLYGEYSEGEVDVFRQLLRPGMVAIDAGANLGAHAIPMARFVGPSGRVLAFEPQRILFQTLCANVALNSLVNVWCHPAALGRAPGVVRVPALDPHRPNNFGGLALDPGDSERPGEPVPVVALDALKLPRCDFIKADVEGMEVELLLGARATIARHRPYLYLEADRPDRVAALMGTLAGLGYRTHPHQPPYFNPRNFAGNRENVFGALISGNLLGHHPGRPIDVESPGTHQVSP